LTSIKNKNSLSSYLWLIVFSLLYGLVHAASPRHRKTLVGAYFMPNNILFQNYEEIEMLATKVSAIVIIFIGVYLLQKKLKLELLKPKKMFFSVTPPQKNINQVVDVARAIQSQQISELYFLLVSYYVMEL